MNAKKACFACWLHGGINGYCSSLGSRAYGKVRVASKDVLSFFETIAVLALLAVPPVALLYVASVLHDRRRRNPYDEIFHDGFADA